MHKAQDSTSRGLGGLADAVGKVGRRTALAVALAAGSAALVGAAPAMAHGPSGGPANAYVQLNLVSDIPGVARRTDAHLINPWGMSAGPSTPLWVSDADADVSTVYSGHTSGGPLLTVPLVVSIPHGAPTGQVYNPTADWVIGSTGPALFIFASESGTISAWNTSSGTAASVGVKIPGASYKGLAISTGAAGHYLYAANFHAGTIDVFDGAFAQQHWSDAFIDPALPAHFAPFNVQAIGDRLYVAYARQDAQKADEVAGPHRGYIDVFRLDGSFIKRLVSRGPLDAPWGLVRAPAGFGRFSRDLLVGNFGDGRISAFDPHTGHFDGQLRHPDGTKVEIQGLWGLLFGNGTAGTPRTLFFSAGIADEAHGLLGTLEAR